MNSFRLIVAAVLFFLAVGAFSETTPPPFSDNESPVFENTYLIDNLGNNSKGADLTLRVHKTAPFGDCKNKTDCPASVIVSHATGNVNMPVDVNVRSLYLGKNQIIDSSGKWLGSPTGLVGPTGAKGDTGATGPQGLQGIQGIQGPKGDTGAQGLKGDTGVTGATGAQGPKGDTGATGAIGPQGLKGETGAQGLKGDTGATGPQGLKGDTGATGPQGAKGDTGAQGPQGLKGETGATGPQGSQGIQGIKGDKGDAGAGCELTADPINGKIVKCGSTIVPFANLIGPQGPQGIKGDKGDTGASGSQGPQGPEGIQGPQGKACELASDSTLGTVIKCGVSVTPLSNLKGEKGDRGIAGPQGAQGLQGIQGIQGGEGPRGPAGFQRCEVVEAKAASGGETRSIIANCNDTATPTIVTGGGCWATNPANLQVWMSMPIIDPTINPGTGRPTLNRYTCTFTGKATVDSGIGARAVCCG
jgi:hypothetical protein